MKQFIVFLIVIPLLLSCANSTTTEDTNQTVIESNSKDKKVPNGEFIQKYPSGAIQIKGEMRNDERVGLWTAYYENGGKQSESTYQNGILHGRTASFYTNGQVRYIGYFLGGKKDGKWEFYSESGEFDKSEMYVKGELSEKKQ